MKTNSVLNAMESRDTQTWNGAVSNSTTGSLVLDYFGKAGSYRGRTQAEVDLDMAKIFGEDSYLATKVLLYNRMVTRTPNSTGVNVEDSLKVHRGQGQKDEFVKSLKWLENNKPNVLYHNLWLIPAIGCWGDLWYDSAATGVYHYVDTKHVYPLIKEAMDNDFYRGLLAKYLPKIRSASKTKTERHRRRNKWARGLCRYLGWTERDYRKFKSDSDNTAHDYQRKMCGRQWSSIDFKTIPGKALSRLVSGKILSNHSLEDKYLKWLETQPVAKFTGYPYELYRDSRVNRNKLVAKNTYNKQFEQLLATARKDVNPELLDKGVLCALDTSSSMTWTTLDDQGTQPYHVGLGLGIYFSSLLTGWFKDKVVSFSSTSTLWTLKGNFCEKAAQAENIFSGGDTNFQSVIDMLVKVRKENPHIPVEEYPEVLLVVSDMQFNPATRSYGDHRSRGHNRETNYEAAMKKLEAVGLPRMTIIWWQVNGRDTKDFPSKISDEGTVLVSGFDGAIVTNILGAPEVVVDKVTGEKRKPNPYEVMLHALDQDLLNMVAD